MEILSDVPAMEDVDLSLVTLSDAFFESKLLSTVFGTWFFCVGRWLLRITNPYNMFAVKTCVNCVVGLFVVRCNLMSKCRGLSHL